MLLMILLACKDSPPPATPAAADETCGSTDWWGAGQPLMLDFCAGCHSSRLVGSQRYGAPEGIDLETLEGAQQHTDRIRARVLEEGDMPPGGGLSTEQLERLSRWLDCADDAPNPLPQFDHTLPDVISAEFIVSISREDSWSVVRRESFAGELWLEEYYLIEGSMVWFGGYTLLDPELFGVERSVLFDPLIPITSSEFPDDWTTTVSAEVEEDGLVTTEEQTWTVSYGAPQIIDNRSVDHNPTEVVMIEDSGEVHAWHLSQIRILSGRWIGTEDTLLQALRTDHYSPDFDQEDEAFPFQGDDTWAESALLIEGVTW